ncbi:MAG: flagellar type III secretion system pore protein FliP [Candidatus Gastranaerophilales bacterium]|nr:flagellar type III secretion system pore protein FliP [Candidatus Gastranaerophilales bacterium]
MEVFNRFKHIFLSLSILLLGALPASAAATLPTMTIGFGDAQTPQDFSQGMQILIMLTILTLAPSIIIMCTSFTRIVIVLSLTRQALGTAQLPPAQVITGLSLILTFFVMSPTINKIYDVAYEPYMNSQITQQEAIRRGTKPLQEFMLRYTDEQELALFVKFAQIEKPKTVNDVPMYVLLPSFILSELKTAFKIGFLIFIPFLIIDIVVASILVSMGMVFLPPAMIATPFKLILFVMVDGWHMIAKSLLEGFLT